MSIKYWIGAASAVAQISTIQITADDAATTYTVTIGNIAISVAGSGTGVNATATALQAALAASTHPYFTAVTWTVATDTVTGTGPSNGFPFVAVSSVSGGIGTIGAVATPTAAQSPHHWAVADNWSGGVPVAADTIIVEGDRTAILFDLDQNALAINDLLIGRSYTGQIGLNPSAFATTAALASSVEEYRDTHLKIDVDRIDIGVGELGTGSGRINLENSKVGASLCQVFHTAAAATDAGQLAVDYVASNASAELHIADAPGGVGVAVKRPSDVATIGEISFFPANGSSRLRARGLTPTNIYQRGGTMELDCAGNVTTLEVNGGVCRTHGAAWGVTAAHVYGGRVVPMHENAGGAIFTTINVWKGGELDLNKHRNAKTITNLKLNVGAVLRIDNHITLTNGLTWWPQAAVITYDADG